MEDKKTSSIGQYKGQNNVPVEHMSDIISPFGSNKAASYLYKKAERLAVALHLVTNVISEEEGVRIRLREDSLSLLSGVFLLKDGFRARPEQTNYVVAYLLEIVSLLEIANASGYLSRMNVEVLGRECIRLTEFIRNVEDTPDAESLALSERYFLVPETESEQDAVGSRRTSRFGSIQVKDSPGADGERKIKDKIGKKVGETAGEVKPHQRHLKRREAILSLIKSQGEVSIKDISGSIKDCSEKTLQRELGALVAEGVLEREGERRWSTYRLKR